jgi:hypothetical protein
VARKDVSVARAASLWDVTPAVVYKWIKVGQVDFFDDTSGAYVATEADVRSAKRIRRKQLRLPPFKISESAVGEAERRGLIRPSADNRFSLDDINLLQEIARGGGPIVPPAEACAAEESQQQGADEQPRGDDRVLRLVWDDGEADGGKADDSKAVVHAKPRQVELDAVLNDARRGKATPFWFYYSIPALMRGDSAYPPTTPISKWWRIPIEVQAEASNDHPLREWFAGRVAYIDNEVIRLDLCGPAHVHHEFHTWFRCPVTPDEWARLARFEPREGQHIFYARYHDAANLNDGLVRILAQPGQTDGALAAPND